MTETRSWIDKLKNYELCARTTLTLDSHDIEGWALCFNEHGEFGYADRVLSGRDTILAYGTVRASLASRHIEQLGVELGG